jgi:hypothetical protein
VRKAVVLAVALTLVSLWAAMAAGLTAVSMTEGVRVSGLVMLTTAIAASLLVGYFDWRGRMLRGFRTQHDAARL